MSWNWVNWSSGTTANVNLTGPKVGDPCQRCGQRPSTTTRTTDGLAFAHGFYSVWCERCVLTEQLTYALKQALRIPKLTTRLLQEIVRP